MKKELTLFVLIALAGLIVLPIAVYLVGNLVFGEYGSDGYSDFFITILAELAKGTITLWLLILSPYIIWQLLRLTSYILRAISHH